MQPTLSRQEKVWQSKGQDACVRYNPPALAATGRIEATAVYGVSEPLVFPLLDATRIDFPFRRMAVKLRSYG